MEISEVYHDQHELRLVGKVNIPSALYTSDKVRKCHRNTKDILAVGNKCGLIALALPDGKYLLLSQ